MRPFFATSGRWLGVAALALALAVPALAQRNVTLRMNSATMPDTISTDPVAAGVQVRGQVASGTTLPGGNTIDWGDNTTLRPTNDGGDYWSIDFEIPDNEKLDFKFYFAQSEGQNLPGGYEDGSNHTIEAGTGDVTLDLHYFEKGDDKAYDWRPFAADGDSVAVWFRVYMNTESAVTKKYTADDDDLVVALRGNFGTLGAVGEGGTITDWGGTEASLTRESSDPARPGYHLFSGLVRYPASAAGQQANYKFYFNDDDVTGDAGYEDGDNRSFIVPTASSDTTLHWVYFSNSPPAAGTAVTSNVTFQVDVAPLSSIGLFQTTNDFVQVRGGFNGWDCPEDNQDDCALGQDVVVPTTYANQIPLTSIAGSEQFYKFYIDFRDENGDPQFQNAAGDDIDVGWEEPLDYGGGNRVFEFSGSEQDLGTQFFNSIRSGNVIDDQTSVDVTFQVTMNEAMKYADQQGRAFDPATDTVSVQFEDVVWLLTQGYIPGSDDLIDTGSGGNMIAGFKLTDPDGDGVYTGTLAVNGPTYNAIGYRYIIGNDTDGLQAEGSGGFDEGRRRYRYITNTSTGAFTLPLDLYRPVGPGNQPMPWEVNPTGTFTSADFSNAIAVGASDPALATANEAGPGRAGALALGAVYPNPTSGVARMSVVLDRDQAVTVRVYDVTGRLVTSVLEDTYVQGTRVVEFDTQALAAGLYVVRAEAGGDVVTRRMTVVR